MNINNIIRCLAVLAFPMISGMASGLLTSCSDDNIESENYYTATKRTAAQLIMDSPARYSQFEAILDRANYKSTLSTYGTFTVFAPDNNAVDNFLKSRNFKSVDEIPMDVCDTIARTHIINKGAFFTTDYMAGTLPEMNMDDRYLVITCDSDVENNNQLLLYVNKLSRITEKDDSVTNGVVHTIDRVLTPSNEFLPDLMEQDSTISIFVEALKRTNMADSLTKFIDETYSCSVDSVKGDTYLPKIRFGGRDNIQHFPEKRYFKFTAFVERNEVFHRYGIWNVDQLFEYAKKVYDKTFPQDAGKYDKEFTDRRNPLNRFVSYHLMDRIGTYSDWAPTGNILTDCCKTNIADAEDFWQTMLDTEGMIRFSRHKATEQLYANRKGKDGSIWKGVKVLDALESGKHEQNAINGIYHYLDDILVYDTNTRDNVLNCRMRIDATTLSADFMNQNCRGHYGGREDELYGLKNNFIKGWKILEGTSIVAVHCDSPWWSSYLGNALCVRGEYDVEITLPQPPPGTYEVRLAYVAGEERGVVQVYFNNEPCDIPVDLTRGAWDPEIGGNLNDSELTEEEILANDKAMHNRGYLRGMDSYGKPGWTDQQSFRTEAKEHVRRVLTTQQFKSGETYKLRFRQVAKGDLEWSFDYIELCPKSVYASPAGEDWH
ncbi:MAG: fasciclin domain-containing protein [Prevotella sp.]|nr:fasciclin domain-containing protein [Prevotella sp.]